jgi:thiamine-phosphate pyrophosphorylase
MTFNAIRSRVLSIAGHDPSGGAGLSADLKVFEAWGLQGQSVCTALTVQNASEFLATHWVSWEQIEAQLETLFSEQPIHYFKIGLIQNAEVLGNVVTWIRKKSPAAFILWDPILKASAGFDFHSLNDREAFRHIAGQLSLVTPNQREAEWLGWDLPCPVLVKGGHQTGDFSVDRLYWDGRQIAEFSQQRVLGANKHGTGCVLSASITALMALGLRMERALGISRCVLQEYLQNTPGLLGNVRDAVASQMHELIEIDSARLYAITWDGAIKSHVEQAKSLCSAGVKLLQLRMKSGTPEARLSVAWQVFSVCRQWGCKLLINDDVELARAIQANGVHLGQGDMAIGEARKRLGSHAWIGGTANTSEQALKHIVDGVDYIGLGPFRYTETKSNLSPVLGPDGVEQVMKVVGKKSPGFPVYVIGGIDAIDCKEILELGATGVAVSSAIVAGTDPLEKLESFKYALCGL